ncbi:MAG: Asp-tRNA(Asn)/Glu-tRNA(Gln) amidotransferase subunit GatC [Granulosicoccus sp.]
MALNPDDIAAIAHLARVGLAPEELEPLAADVSSVLTLVEQLQAIDTTGIEPMAHPASASLWLREDAVTETDQRDTLQEPAPESQDGYFLVPRVIE